ncbi:MAG: UbiA family prenyltransferase, partial [Halobacteriales archaeon]
MSSTTPRTDVVWRHGRTKATSEWLAGLALLPLRQTGVGVAKVFLAAGLLSRPPGPAMAVIALLTLAVYAHNDLTDRREDTVNDPGRADEVAARARTLGFAVAVAAVAAVGTAATGGPLATGLALFPLAVAAAYNAPLLPGSGPARLKEVLVVNTVATAAAWAVPVALLPVAFAGAGPGMGAWLVVGYLFVRTYVASEFANVDDVAGDAAAGVRTLPVVSGPTATRRALLAVDASTLAALAVAAAVGALGVATALALAAGVAVSVAVLSGWLPVAPGG